MATKTSQPAAPAPAEAGTVKNSAEETVKVQASEELRRRRAGIACFL